MIALIEQSAVVQTVMDTTTHGDIETDITSTEISTKSFLKKLEKKEICTESEKSILKQLEHAAALKYEILLKQIKEMTEQMHNLDIEIEEQTKRTQISRHKCWAQVKMMSAMILFIFIIIGIFIVLSAFSFYLFGEPDMLINDLKKIGFSTIQNRKQ